MSFKTTITGSDESRQFGTNPEERLSPENELLVPFSRDLVSPLAQDNTVWIMRCQLQRLVTVAHMGPY